MSDRVELDNVPPNRRSNMEASEFVDNEKKMSTPARAPPYNAADEVPDPVHSVLSEFKRAESKSFRSMLLRNCSDIKDSSIDNLSLGVEAKLQLDPSFNKSCEEARHIAHHSSAGLSTQQTEVLDKPRVEIERSLIDIVCNDNAECLVLLLQKIVQALKLDEGSGKAQKYQDFEAILSFWFPHRLLQLACQLDSVACAEALLEEKTELMSPVNAVDECGKTALHYAANKLSTRCIELLLRKHAKTDVRSKDGCIPLKLALQTKRWQKDLQTLPAIDIITILRKQDLTAVKLLASHTKDVMRLACHLAFDGDVVALTALILAAGKFFLGEEQKYELFLDLVVEKTLTRHRADEIACETYRSSILKSLEIIVLLKRDQFAYSSLHVSYETQGKRPSALLRATQAGDEGIIKILLHDASNVNQADSDGNTALHWCLKTTKNLRIVWQLVTHGSAVGARNRLGLTPVHIAAGQGHLQALQLLLAQEPGTVHIASVTKETPLFLAVKNNHVECAKLLLQCGSNSQTLNLRRQRPVDFASTEDMRMILNSDNGKCATGKVQPNSELNFFKSTFDRHQSPAECEPASNLDGADFDMQIDRFIESKDDLEDSEYWLMRTQHAKTALCRYHMMPGGCARGDGCFYAHGQQELLPEAREKAKVTNVFDQKKVFVGGLLPSMGSVDLKNYFEAEFGPVQDAIVMNSQNGGHIQSRGFGFVTFKKEASCLAAVKQHYVTICGKRVEIKAAFHSSKRTDEEMLSIHLSGPAEWVLHCPETFNDTKWNNITKAETSGSFKGTQKAETAAGLSSPRKCSPPWLAVFKKWLPAFLSSVAKRQQGAECYPLSSVKADFRATCGMELDHIALGFPKLSDFLRTMPELCRMKIVPVGRGPATHVVLQGRQQSLATKAHKPAAATKILASSLVHEGRTYADAAGHNIETPLENKKAEQITESEDYVPDISHQMKGAANSNLDDNCGTHHFSVAASDFEDSAAGNHNNQQQDVINSENLSLFSTFNTEGSQQIPLPRVDAFKVWQQGLARSNLSRQNLPQFLQASMISTQFHSASPEAPATASPPQKNILSFSDMYHIPYMEEKVPFSPFPERDFPSFRRNAAPFYNPWNSNTFEGCRNLIQQMNVAATGEESPQSSLTSEDSIESPQKSIKGSSNPCVLCGDKAAVWVAIPCSHKAICSPCKSQLHNRNLNLQRCFVCQGRAREWIAQYY